MGYKFFMAFQASTPRYGVRARDEEEKGPVGSVISLSKLGERSMSFLLQSW